MPKVNTEKCVSCGCAKPEEDIAYTQKEDQRSALCWSCWDAEEEERENAMATLD